MGAWLRLIILSIIWGSSFILMKKGLFAPDGSTLFSGVQLAALRILSAFIVISPFAIYHLRKVNKKKIPIILFSGLLGNGIPAVLFAVAQTQINSSITGILNSLTPFFTLLLGLVIFKVNINKKAVWGVIIGMAGACYLVLSKGGQGESNVWYTLLIVLATMCYGANVNLIKEHLPNLSSLQISSISFLFIGFIAFIYVIITDTLNPVWNQETYQMGLLYICLLGVLGTAIALILFNQLIQVSSAVFASSVTYLIPIVAIIWGLWDGEILSAGQWIASLVILSGVKIMRG